jgi:intracellular multiplication protein IcmL
MTQVKSTPPNPAARKPAGANIPRGEGLEVVVHRNNFYKEGDKKLVFAAGFVVVVLLIQIFVAVLGFTARNERVYIATNPNGSLINMVPLKEPNQKDPIVAQWLQNALVDTFSFNWTNISTNLSEATTRWFTDTGAKELLKAMDDSGNFKVISDKHMLLTTTLDSTPILVGKSPTNTQGVFFWTFQVDAIMTFRTQSQEFTNKVRFTVTVERRSVLEDVAGLGISKVVMTKR